MIISIAMVSIAAIASAVMDRTEEEVHFNQSIFSKKNPKFWLKPVSWRYAKKVFGWKYDIWHVAKSTMVICMVCGMIFYTTWLPYYLDIFLLGSVWNLSFNLFYNKLLKSDWW